ncbi:MAG: hypothetical protein AAGC88_00855 [Bacteroidota bacterium]
MNNKLAITVIHGIGSMKDASEFNKTVNKLKGNVHKRLKKKYDIDEDQLDWQPIFWSDITQPKQDLYFDQIKNSTDWNKLRKFIVSFLSDATAYRQTSRPDVYPVYEKINERIEQSMSQLLTGIGNENTPLLVLGHSLGCHIMTNYIYDRQNSGEPDSFKNFSTMKGLITFGNNMPLFAMAYDNIVPISLPNGCLWNNVYDEDDVLGYPLKPLSGYDNLAGLKDIKIDSGSAWTMWNPLSHNGYWTDGSFAKIVAKEVDRILNN